MRCTADKPLQIAESSGIGLGTELRATDLTFCAPFGCRTEVAKIVNLAARPTINKNDWETQRGWKTVQDIIESIFHLLLSLPHRRIFLRVRIHMSTSQLNRCTSPSPTFVSSDNRANWPHPMRRRRIVRQPHLQCGLHCITGLEGSVRCFKPGMNISSRSWWSGDHIQQSYLVKPHHYQPLDLFL